MGGAALSVLAQPAFAQVGAGESVDDIPATVAEILVTGGKRSERLQDVPTSVDVMAGEQLARQNIAAVPDLVRASPALNASGAFGALSIRGIGSVGYSRSSEGSVGVVIDNVSLASGSTTPPQLFDVARVELLEGPQGTLFGRNSSAGVLNIVTNAPNPARFESAGHADIGSRNAYIVQGLVNVPVSGAAALRVTGAYNQQPDVMKNLNQAGSVSIRESSARARLLWEPTSDLTINLIGDYDYLTKHGDAPFVIYYAKPGSPLAEGLAACGVRVGPSNDEACVDNGKGTSFTTYGLSGQIDWKLGEYTLSSISAYRKFRQGNYLYDVDSQPVYLLTQFGSQRSSNLSQEFRLTSPTGGAFEYVAGLFYFETDYEGDVSQLGPILGLRGNPAVLGQTRATTAKTRSYAAFGQGALRLSSKLRLNLGARINREEVSARTMASVHPDASGPAGSIANVDGSVSDNDFSYKVGFQYQAAPDVMTYANYTRGYKGPAINDQGGGAKAPVVVRPEVPHAYELGVKSSWLDGRLAVNAAAFYTKVNDFQAQYFDPSLGVFVYGNAPSLTSKGVEFHILGRPVPGLKLDAGGSFTDAKYGAGFIVSCGQGQTQAQGCETLRDGSGAAIGTGDDADGNRLIGTPRWKGTFSAEYERPISSALDGFVQVDAVYTSKVNWSAAYDPRLSTSGAVIVGGRLGVRTSDARYGVALFVRNLFDVYRPTVRTAAPTAAQQLSEAYSQYSGPESHRIVGLSLDGRF
jgi:iron complex outermembrane receptor protein